MDKCQWKIGDALLKEIPMGEESKHNNASIKLEECSEELKKHGHSVSSATLKIYRITASNFPAVRRLTAVSFSAHQEAGSPEMLEQILKINKGVASGFKFRLA